MRQRTAALVLACLLTVGCGDDDGAGDNDNGNDNSPDLLCGNGTMEGLEECDNGQSNSDTQPDACRTNCTLARCGDGVPDTGEECDSSSQNADNVPNACRTDCTFPVCGDDVIDTAFGEACDDGNTDDGDGCSANCWAESCGNGVLDLGEACDDGNHEDGDGCSANCASDESCGNAIRDAHEVCDDGNTVGGDGCSADCVSLETCGNGYPDLDAGEMCDDGNYDPGDGCGPTCLLEFCGNGYTDPGEACDDGNNTSGDGCSADCISNESCGNGYVDTVVGEQCDDGNLISGDGCQANCHTPNCGDGVLDQGEVCDDGNHVDGDGCNRHCTSDETCGNSIIDPAAGEQCDDGNLSPGDNCGPTCLLEGCGNLVVDPGEQCDDGNFASGDGCSADCTSDETCGNGYLDFMVLEQCDDGNLDPGDGCSPLCELEFCGNGILDPTEICDDGNAIAGDGCSPDCRSLEVCGNSYVDNAIGEQCDDGNGVSGDGCGNACLLEYCGNGYVDTAIGEQCDDGNSASGDGCSGDCSSNETCGNGVLDSGEECDDGNHLSHDRCSSGCTDETMQWVQVYAIPVPPRRYHGQMVYWPTDQTTLIFGGYHNVWFGDLWELTPGPTWTNISPAYRPGGRSWHSMVYDSTRDRIVLFGGRALGTHNFFSDTWTYDGSDFELLNPTTIPLERGNASMAYDSIRDRVVMHGGEEYWGPTNDTWEFDGTQWYDRTQPTKPRSTGGDMTFDSARGRCVFHGGGTTSNPNGTWEWDGSWSKLTPMLVEPPFRVNPVLVYDSERMVTVMFGGQDAAGQVLNETWEFDGFNYTWTEITALPAPMNRVGHQMSYDPDRQRVVLFGGANLWEYATIYYDDTWEYRWQSSWPEEDCGNGVDDDSDGLLDCLDPDCTGVTGC